jgi:hypothetical protein
MVSAPAEFSATTKMRGVGPKNKMRQATRGNESVHPLTQNYDEHRRGGFLFVFVFFYSILWQQYGPSTHLTCNRRFDVSSGR